MRRKLILTMLLFAGVFAFAGCGSKASDEPKARKEKTADKDDADEDEDISDKDAGGSKSKKDSLLKKKEQESDPAKDDGSEEKSLAEKMCGKYSYHDAKADGSEEFLIMDVVSFGDNLYAFCGNAMPEDSEELEAYSFWTTEFIPFDVREPASEDGDTLTVNAFNFSIMSNAGEYWDMGHSGTITLTDDGLVFGGFGNDGFLVPEGDDSRLFLKDDRVEDAFDYLKHDAGGNKDLQGYWIQDDCVNDYYVRFEGSDMYMYSKAPGEEVFFAAGGCDMKDGSFDCRGNYINNGSPFDFTAEYKADGDKLTLEITDGEAPDSTADSMTLRRINKSDVHVTTMDEMLLGDDDFGPLWAEENGPFFGLWLEAFKEKDAADALVEKLEEKDLPAYCIYSCDWENLNKDPYFLVTLGRSGSESEAQSYIEDAKKAGYANAYVKYTGERLRHRIDYTVHSTDKIRISPERAVLGGVMISDLSGGVSSDCTLIVDGDTVFDESCETEFFELYEDGMSPLDWFNRVNETKDNGDHPDAIRGVFEVDINGNHVDRFYGSYWWD